MAVALTLHAFDGTQIGPALSPATQTAKKDTNTWMDPAAEDGSGGFVAKGSQLTAAQLAQVRIVRVNNGTRDVFAFVPTTKTRRALDSPGTTEVDLSGPGVRWLLHAAQLLPEDTSDCAYAGDDTRWLGWMSKYYDDSAWSPALSFGSFLTRGNGFWVSPRPKDWPAPLSEYITITTAAVQGVDWGARTTFEVTAEVELIPVAAADDEYRVWLDGTLVIDTIGGGPFQWMRWQQQPLKVCPGTHQLAVQVRNLDRPSADTNYTWLLFALAQPNDEGNVRAANQRYNVFHDATGGTFTLTTWFGKTTTALAHNANATAVQAALEANVGAGNVTVSGSGSVSSPWKVEFVGQLVNKKLPLTANGGSLTGGTGIEVHETQIGRGASAVVRSDDTWKVRSFAGGVPGLTATHMLRIAVEEARARGETVLDHISLGFTDTHDTAGQALPELVLPVALEADDHRLVVMLEELGYQIAMAPDLTLQLWANRGADLTGSVGITAWTEGIRDLAATVAEGDVKNVLRVRTAAGWHEVIDEDSVAARGRWEDGTSLDGFSSPAEAEKATGPLVARYATPARSTTCEIRSGAGIVYDLADIGDVVTGSAWSPDTDDFDETAMRLVSIMAQVQETQVLYSVELID